MESFFFGDAYLFDKKEHPSYRVFWCLIADSVCQQGVWRGAALVSRGTHVSMMLATRGTKNQTMSDRRVSPIQANEANSARSSQRAVSMDSSHLSGSRNGSMMIRRRSATDVVRNHMERKMLVMSRGRRIFAMTSLSWAKCCEGAAENY